jgi:hypothetical protein
VLQDVTKLNAVQRHHIQTQLLLCYHGILKCIRRSSSVVSVRVTTAICFRFISNEAVFK